MQMPTVCYSYNPTSDSWSLPMKPSPYLHSSQVGGVYGNKIFFVHDTTPGTFDSFFVFIQKYLVKVQWTYLILNTMLTYKKLASHNAYLTKCLITKCLLHKTHYLLGNANSSVSFSQTCFLKLASFIRKGILNNFIILLL